MIIVGKQCPDLSVAIKLRDIKFFRNDFCYRKILFLERAPV
jgi:hypothetical protein